MNKFILVFTFIIVYIFLANLLSNFLEIREVEKQTEKSSEFDLSLGFFDKVTTSVVRPRWYGTIYEQGTQANLNLFNVVGIPIKVNGKNWAYFHLFALVLVVGYSYKQIKLNREKKWESNLDGELQSYSYYHM